MYLFYLLLINYITLSKSNEGVYRTNGILSLSRAIGDKYLRPAITSAPDISSVLAATGDEFIIVSTDGLWHVFSSQGAVDFVNFLLSKVESTGDNKRENLRENMSKLLINEALRKGETDNMSVVVRWL